MFFIVTIFLNGGAVGVSGEKGGLESLDNG
ncbi:hypothetical protein CPAL_13340 [Clostridium thermopalmarium DSM 5974]|uniref:Uncharacterized protein n=1 Tax=Clostridium thermopalmarium DSM 5974 TaxID=1121340 RepID=A0A2T0ASQ3_9CLOT|nr:hypothetical protein CPAL_13340 [Clostridium thermopalmarium DSM 5974]